MTSADLLRTLETYYDAAPRPATRTEEIGPFTLFVRTDPEGWPYYARPRLGVDATITAAEVEALRDRQRRLDVPQALEWVHETTPSLLRAARAAGMHVERCPLLVLRTDPTPTATTPDGIQVEVLRVDAAGFDAVAGAVHAGFEGLDVAEPRDSRAQAAMVRAGLLTVVGAYDRHGAVLGGGSHSPRGTTTELTGIAVLPRARRRGVGAAITRALVEDARRRGLRTIFLSAQDDAVARVYERVGFARVGTACVAGPVR